EYQHGTVNNTLSLVIYAREDAASGQYDNVVRYVDPPRDAGKIVLLNGSRMWFYDPASKASVRISPQQRLIGEAANGDVVSVNLARDYK
ncbi:outer membrane lipoprotein-sorting protein, partial [Acinetobacter baumannii]